MSGLTQFNQLMVRLQQNTTAAGEALDSFAGKVGTAKLAPPLIDAGDGKGGGLTAVVVRDGTAPANTPLGAIYGRFETVAKKLEEMVAAQSAGETGPVTTESLLANRNITPELRRILETANLPGIGSQPGLGNDLALSLIEQFIRNERELARADLTQQQRFWDQSLRNNLIAFFGQNFRGSVEGFARELERLRADAARPVTPSRTSATTRRTAGQSTGLRVGVLTGDLR